MVSGVFAWSLVRHELLCMHSLLVMLQFVCSLLPKLLWLLSLFGLSSRHGVNRWARPLHCRPTQTKRPVDIRATSIAVTGCVYREYLKWSVWPLATLPRPLMVVSHVGCCQNPPLQESKHRRSVSTDVKIMSLSTFCVFTTRTDFRRYLLTAPKLAARL